MSRTTEGIASSSMGRTVSILECSALMFRRSMSRNRYLASPHPPFTRFLFSYSSRASTYTFWICSTRSRFVNPALSAKIDCILCENKKKLLSVILNNKNSGWINFSWIHLVILTNIHSNIIRIGRNSVIIYIRKSTISPSNEKLPFNKKLALVKLFKLFQSTVHVPIIVVFKKFKFSLVSEIPLLNLLNNIWVTKLLHLYMMIECYFSCFKNNIIIIYMFISITKKRNCLNFFYNLSANLIWQQI